MRLSSKLLLRVARMLPRGGWRIVRFAARRDSALWSFVANVKGCPRPVFMDLRDVSSIPFYLHGDGGGNRKLRRFLAQVLRDGDYFFDVGANIGMVSLLAADLVGQKGQVHAFEPNPDLTENLAKTLAPCDNSVLHSIALSGTTGEVTFYASESSALSGLRSDGKAVQVECRTLVDVIRDNVSPDILKIDVEGAEEEVFSGVGRSFESFKCPIIIFEALNSDELENSLARISALHLGSGRFYNIASYGRLQTLEESRESSDYVYVPEHKDRAVSHLMPTNLPEFGRKVAL